MELNELELLDGMTRTAFEGRFGVAAGTPFVDLAQDGPYVATTGRADPEGAGLPS